MVVYRDIFVSAMGQRCDYSSAHAAAAAIRDDGGGEMSITKEELAMAEKIKIKLLSALGADGMLILDNELEFLIDIIDAYEHFDGFDEEEI